jgi:hypothetical protein
VHRFGGGIQAAFIGDDEFEYSRFGREELQAGKFPRVSYRVEGGVHVDFPTASGTA